VLQASVWSPDGNFLSFECFTRTSETFSNLYRTDARGGNRAPVRLGDLRPTGNYQWTRDGKAIVTAATSAGRTNIWMLPMFGVSEPRQLTMDFDRDWSPSLDPDGKSLVFQRTHETSDLLHADLKTGNQREVFKTQAQAQGPTFWPDGRGTYFSHSVNGVGTIMSVSLSDGASTLLTEEGDLSCSSPLALDGQTLAFVCEKIVTAGGSANPTAPREISAWKANPSGGQRAILFEAKGAIDLRLLAVSPSRRRLLYLMEDLRRTVLTVYDMDRGVHTKIIEINPSEALIAAAWSGSEGEITVIRSLNILGPPPPKRWVQSILLGSRTIRPVRRIPDQFADCWLSLQGRDVVCTTVEKQAGTTIWLLAAAGTPPPRKLAQLGAGEEAQSLCLSPDGTSLVIQRGRSTTDLYQLENF